MVSDSRFRAKLFFLFALGISVWAYYPGLSGTFIFDDVTNISRNHYLAIDQFSFEDLWQAAWSSYSGPLRRPVVMFSFALNHVFTGMDPWWMKLSNVVIHICNALILLLLCKALFCQISRKESSVAMAAPYVIAGIWLVHPINVTAVSYIVQRMTSLSATFVLLAIYCYLQLRNGKINGWKARILGLLILLFWALGLFSKEIAITLSIYVFVIEWCIYGFHTHAKSERRFLWLLWTLITVPWVLALCFFIYKPSFLLGDYGFRDFTVSERVLTEFRIVIDYLRLIIIPDIQDMGLYHDDIAISTSFFRPVSTLLSLLLIIGLISSAIYVKRKYPLYSLGILWFFGGHIVESSIYPLELMFLHRNYLPSIGILLVLAEAVMYLHRTHRNIITVAVLSIFILFSLATRSLAYQWSGDYRMLLLEAMNHPDSIRANFRAAQVYKAYAIATQAPAQKAAYRGKALEYFANIENLDKHDMRGLMGILQTYLQLKEDPPRPLIENLINAMKFARLDGGAIHTLQSYKDCMIAVACHLQINDYHRIIQALLNNPNVAGDFRRKLLVIHAEYLAKARGNIDAAITTMLEAIIEYPTADDLMQLALYYEAGGYRRQVIRTIDYLEKQDKLGRFRKFIRETRERIKQTD